MRADDRGLIGDRCYPRPDLFRAVICEELLLDMVRYHRFGSGRTWVSEYGSADRVDSLHALKMAAALQAASTGSGPVLLGIEANAGHGG